MYGTPEDDVIRRKQDQCVRILLGIPVILTSQYRTEIMSQWHVAAWDYLSWQGVVAGCSAVSDDNDDLGNL
jgi:hypothetical protein